MVVASSVTGQRALLPLPSKSLTSKRNVENYPLPDELIVDKASFASKGGMAVAKLGKGGKLQARRIAISPNRRDIWISTSRIHSIGRAWKAATGRDGLKVVPLALVDRIQRGHNSARFSAALENDELPNLLNNHAESLSIVYYNFDSESLELIDLVVLDPVNFELLLSALEDLVALAREERMLATTSLQLVRFHYATMNKEYASQMNLNEFISLVEKLQVPLKKGEVQRIFLKASGEDNALSLASVADLLQDMQNTVLETTVRANPMERLWNQLVMTDPVPSQIVQEVQNVLISEEESDEESISAVALLSFVRSQQKQYNTTLEDIQDLIYKLNQQHSAKDMIQNSLNKTTHSERLTKSHFLHYIWSDANDIMDPFAGQGSAQDMNQPLSRYWINTAHDTYLNREGVVDEECYLAALLRGVRCLEIDLWDYKGKPVISRSSGISGVPLKNVLRSIRHFLQQLDPYCFPVILKIENHCSPAVQRQVAQLIYEILGAAQLVIEPVVDLELDNTHLPSPEEARGKVIIMAKRPRKVYNGCQVEHDDFDDENDDIAYEPPSLSPFQNEGTIIGFNRKGPIRSNDPDVYERSPEELYETAKNEAVLSEADADSAKERVEKLLQMARNKEVEVQGLTARSGLSTEEVKRRASRTADRKDAWYGEEKNPKDEGIEIHDVLPAVLEGGEDRYACAAQEALEAQQYVSFCESQLSDAQRALKSAKQEMDRDDQRQNEIAEEARRAAAEATMHREYADAAKARVEKVRDLLQNSQENASSAGTVVVTALTEAKISEKRAQDAEARAARASLQAKRDRARADEESRQEDELEEEVDRLYKSRSELREAAKNARQRVEKAAAMLERVNEQIQAIENSSQYRREVLEGVSASTRRNSDNLVSQIAAKLEEREKCRELIKEASAENLAADELCNKIEIKVQDATNHWKDQAQVATQARKVADRSAQVAEELAEHADEEREAAQLRLVAKKRAETSVENRDSYRESLQTQLNEAERASAEAAKIAVQSRKRAEKLAQDVQRSRDRQKLETIYQEKLIARNEAKSTLTFAKEEKERKDSIAAEEKHRLATNKEVYNTSVKNSIVDVQALYIQEAIVGYNELAMLQQQLREAAHKLEIASSKAQEKLDSLRMAHQYKLLMSSVKEIPSTLARLTLLHSARFRNWETSLGYSEVYIHSFAQNVLVEMTKSKMPDHAANLRTFTKKHLCRVFPSLRKKSVIESNNYDPLLAWSLGCQLASINYQLFDENVLTADGRFRQGGSTGYVLKPGHISDDSSKESPMEKWTFDVIGGINLPAPSKKALHGSIYVKLSLFTGSSPPSVNKTPPVQANRLCPLWTTGNSFDYIVDDASVSIICFSVWSAVDGVTEFLAGSALPVSCIREGLRSVALFDADHSRSAFHAYASLLVRLTKRS